MRLLLEHALELQAEAHDVLLIALRTDDPAADARAAGLDPDAAAELAAEAERTGFDGSIGATCSVRLSGGRWVVGVGATQCAVATDWRRVASAGWR